MPSLQCRLITFFLRHTRKQAFMSAEGLHSRLKIARRREDHRPPRRLASRVDIEEREIGGAPVYEVRPKGMPDSDCQTRILYFHGGAYVFQITHFHWRFIAEMAERLKARISVPVYPLAPEHRFDAIYEPVRELHRQACAETLPERLVLMGDSAGAHMAVVLTMMAARENLPRAARLVLISPGLDMSLSNPRLRELEKIDPWLGIDGGIEAVRLYAPDFDLDDWRISPTFGDVSVLPETLILTGTRDLLSDDATIFADKAREAGVDVELHVGQDMFHVWPLADIPEARPARDRIVAFLSDLVAGPEPAVTPPRLRETSPS